MFQYFYTTQFKAAKTAIKKAGSASLPKLVIKALVSSLGLFVLSTCSYDRTPSRVNVTFSAPESQKMQQSVNNLVAQEQWQRQQSSGGVGTYDFGLQDPEIASQIDCYLILVDYPEINSGVTCTGAFGTADVDEIIGFTSVNDTATASLLPGSGRTFYLAVASSVSACEAINSTNEVNISNPISVGTDTFDVTTSTSEIQLTGILTTGNRIQDCSGGEFENLVEITEPTSLSGLVAWYDPVDNETVFTDSSCTTAASALAGNSVGCLKDKSGNGNNATQGTAADRPTYVSAGVNSRNVLTFDGTTDYLNTPITAFLPGTIILVMDSSTAPGGTKTLIGSQSSGPADSLIISTTVSEIVSGSIGNSISASGSTDIITGTPHILAATFTSSTYNLLVDNLTIDEAANSGTATLTSPVNLAIGGLNNNGTITNRFAGSILEILIYNRVLSSAELTDLETYLRSKWGTP